MHPFGRIPALRDGEIALFETSAIVRYLDECFGSAATLLPGSQLARAQCEQWVSAVNAYLYDTMVRRYVLQYLFPRGAAGQPDRGVIDGALKDMPAQLAALDKAYGAGDWLAGGALSMADLFVAPILAYVERMPEGPALLAAAPNVQRAQATLRRRESFIRTDPTPPPKEQQHEPSARQIRLVRTPVGRHRRRRASSTTRCSAGTPRPCRWAAPNPTR